MNGLKPIEGSNTLMTQKRLIGCIGRWGSFIEKAGEITRWWGVKEENVTL